MKTILPITRLYLLFILIAGTITAARAQQMYALTSTGGANHSGTIVKANTDGTGFTTVYNFIDATGSTPVGTMVLGNDSLWYGNCETGGGEGSCVIFSFDCNTNTYTMLFDYGINNGDVPTSGLIRLPDGTLWGTSSSGGANLAGVIYSFDPVASVYTDVFDFSSDTTAAYNSSTGPIGPPMLGADGKLYGIISGDIYGDFAGNIYSYDIATKTYTDLHHFDGITEGYGYGGLLQLNDGKLYGVSSGVAGYVYGYAFPGYFPVLRNNLHGNIFSIDPVTQTYTNLYSFDSINGQNPMCTLTQGADGKLYGTAFSGGQYNQGTIFSFDLSNNSYHNLYSFDSVNTGSHPCSDLTSSTDGNLYGSTYLGGSYNGGVFFSFNPASSHLNVIANLDTATTGGRPQGGSFSIYAPQTVTTIPAVEEESRFSLYPVPASNYVMAQLQLKQSSPAVMNMYDEAGRNVWNRQTLLPAGDSNTYIDLKDITVGTYLLQVKMGNKTLVKSVVVQ